MPISIKIDVLKFIKLRLKKQDLESYYFDSFFKLKTVSDFIRPLFSKSCIN